MANITTKMARLLKLLEFKPRYSTQIAELAPDMFTGSQTSLVHKGRVYNMLTRAQKAGLIEPDTKYKPPREETPATNVIWYRITSQGRKALNEMRASIDNGVR